MVEKFLFQPVKPFVITQAFGEDKVCIDVKTNAVFEKPVNGTCPVGSQSVYSNMHGHNGLDLFALRWAPVRAAHDGVVTEVSTEVDRGLGVGITTNRKWYCKETGKEELFKTRYWHLIALDVHVGDKINMGDFIGFADSTGYSSGDHLHFELKVVDELGQNKLQRNGYFGAIDPTPYLENIYVMDFVPIWKQVKEITATLAQIVADRLRGH